MDKGFFKRLDQELVHPLADVEHGVHSMLDREEGMSTARIIVEPGLDAALFQGCLVEVRLMRWATQIFITDQELAWGSDILNESHGRAIEEVNLLFYRHRAKIELL